MRRMRLCEQIGCSEMHYAKGLCEKHYKKIKLGEHLKNYKKEYYLKKKNEKRIRIQTA